MATNAGTGKITQVGPSPYLKISANSPPDGAHLSWFTSLSNALQGANSSGKVYAVKDAAQQEVGEWKAIGGLVFFSAKLSDAGTYAINLPGEPRHPGPLIFSDGQNVWPDSSGIVTVTTTNTSVNGWATFWG